MWFAYFYSIHVINVNAGDIFIIIIFGITDIFQQYSFV